MAKTFTINFFEYEFTIPKSNIVFHKGYGLVNAVYKTNANDEDEIKLIGLVDKHFNTVIPLCPDFELERISVFANNNIIFMINMGDDEESEDVLNNEIYHMQINEDGENFYALYKAIDYVVIDDDLVKFRFFTDIAYTEQLYSVREKKFIGQEYSRISNFEIKGKSSTATAAMVLPYDKSGINLLTFKINKQGEIISDIKDKDFGIIYDKTSDLDECVNDTLKRMNANTKVRVLDKASE